MFTWFVGYSMCFFKAMFFNQLILLLLTTSLSAKEFRFYREPENNITKYSDFISIEEHGRYHYIFVKSEKDPKNDPLIIIWESARGCSGLYHFFTSSGPFNLNKNSELMLNPYSWSKFANILMIDLPYAAGFSSSKALPDMGDDKDSSFNLYFVLMKFFQSFSDYKKNDIYLAGTGESAFPLVSLANVLKEDTYKLNLNVKGFIVGNAMFAPAYSAFTKFIYLYNHGLIDEREQEEVRLNCCGGSLERCESTSPSRHYNRYCKNFFKKIMSPSAYADLNPYNIYSKCEKTSSIKTYGYWRQFLGTDFYQETKNFPCKDVSPLTTFLNHYTTRLALGITPENPKWVLCRSINFFSESRLIDKTLRNHDSHGLRMLFYTGDLDATNNLVTTQRFISELGIEETSKKKAILLDNKISGFTIQYNNIQFTTILGAGFAGLGKELQTFNIIKNFIGN